MSTDGSGIINNKLKRKVSFSVDAQQTAAPSLKTKNLAKISPIDEQFISQIVLTPTPLEQPLANVLRSIFTAGRAEEFMETLENWSARKEEEIEAVCAEGYGLFVPTVETILGRVREASANLESKSSTLRQEISSSAHQIYDTRVERFEARKMLFNVGKAIHAVEDCLKALNLLQMIQLEIADGHEHAAVKLIDELQGKGILRAVEEMPFYPQLLKSLEQCKKRVWDSATGQVKKWLSSVREESALMGSLALSQLQTRYEQFQRQTHTTSKPFELFLSEVAAEDAAIITSNDLVKVDFGPLQSSLRLFSMMDKRSELIDLLIETRKVQLDLILSMRVGLERPDTDPKSLRSFLNALTGFFIFERLLTRIPLAIYPVSHLESHWELTQTKIREIALESLRLSSSDRSSFMKIKWQLVFFIHALEMFGFPKTQLLETVLTLFYRYVDLLRQDSIEKCSAAIERDTFESGLQSAYKSNAQYSSSLADCLQIIQTGFLASFSVFLEGVPGCANRSVDFSDLARKTVDDQILPACSREYLKRITQLVQNNDIKTSTSAQLAQILKTISDLENLCAKDGELTISLLNYSTDTTNSNSSSKSAKTKLLYTNFSEGFQLNSAAVFREALQKAYEKTTGLVKEDLQHILDKISYQQNPKSLNSSPSASIQELLVLLNSLLPAALDVEAFWAPLLASICHHFDTKILYDVKYPHFSELFFRNLAVDLRALEAFFISLPRKSDQFLAPLSALLEMCALLQAESIHEYLDPLVRKRKYSHVQTDRIVNVLGKLKEPADKRQSVEDLILLLK